MFAEANAAIVDDGRQESQAELFQVQLPLFDERDVARLSRKANFAVRAARTYPPINAEKIARDQRVRFVRVVPQRQAGYLFPLGAKDRTGFGVHLRAGDSRQRQRFTLCHETAHTLLDDFDGSAEYRCDDVALTSKEQLTNLVAGELLFPWRFFEADFMYLGLSLDSVETLAKRYDASLEATAIHCVTKCRRPAAMFVIRPSRSPQGPSQLTHLKLGYARGDEQWDRRTTSWLVNCPTVRNALEQRRCTGTVAARRRTGELVTLQIEAGRYPLTIAGQRRERVLALVWESPEGRGGDDY